MVIGHIVTYLCHPVILKRALKESITIWIFKVRRFEAIESPRSSLMECSYAHPKNAMGRFFPILCSPILKRILNVLSKLCETSKKKSDAVTWEKSNHGQTLRDSWRVTSRR